MHKKKHTHHFAQNGLPDCRLGSRSVNSMAWAVQLSPKAEGPHHLFLFFKLPTFECFRLQRLPLWLVVLEPKRPKQIQLMSHQGTVGLPVDGAEPDVQIHMFTKGVRLISLQVVTSNQNLYQSYLRHGTDFDAGQRWFTQWNRFLLLRTSSWPSFSTAPVGGGGWGNGLWSPKAQQKRADFFRTPRQKRRNAKL